MLDKIFQNAADGMLIIKNGIFIECNDATVKMLGYENKEQVINTHPSELSPEFQDNGRSSIEMADYNIKIAIEEGSNTFEWIHLRANGDQFWVEVVLSNISNSDSTLILVTWREISHRKRLEKQNEHQKMLLDSVINSSMDLIFYKDYSNLNGKYIGCNDAFCKFVGQPKEKIVNFDDFDLFGNDIGLSSRKTDNHVIKVNKEVSNEHWITYPSGEKVLLHTSKTPLKNKFNEIIGILGISRDMTQEYRYKESLKKSVEKQKSLASIDVLTGINNRRSFYDLADGIMKLGNRVGFVFSLLMIDLDFFKNINDTYGHLIGDEMLIHISKTIKNSIRKSDLFARYGGEEFVLILPDTKLDDAYRIGENIRVKISENVMRIAEKEIPISISIGIHQYTNEKSITQVIDKADSALYYAKNHGRNRVEKYLDIKDL